MASDYPLDPSPAAGDISTERVPDAKPTSTWAERLRRLPVSKMGLALLTAGFILGWLVGRAGPYALGLTIGALLLVALGVAIVLDRRGPARSAEGVEAGAATATRATPQVAAWVGWLLFGLALGVYAVTRLYALEDFPIFFFTDEAIQSVLASELVSRGLKDASGKFLPAYFPNGQYWNLSLSIYMHALPVWLFGKTIFVTRATSALFSLFGAVAVGLILKEVFRVRVWWLGVLVLAITPSWFLHSRTAFETVMMVSFYAWFLLFYLLYRTRSPWFLFPALAFGAATFYAYANGQAVMAVSGLLLLLSDLRYHLKHWKFALPGAALIALLAYPYLSFRQEKPEVAAQHLRILDSYLFHALTPQEKFMEWVRRYSYGLSPQYWFFSTDVDLIRHRWLGMGFLNLVTFPFWLAGIGLSLWKFLKSSPHRTVIIASLAAPFGASLADIGIARVLAFVVPAAILTVLGVDWLLGLFRSPKVYAIGAGLSFVVTTLIALWMLREAVVRGPLWYDNYGLYGMQWGAKQLFTEMPRVLEQDPTIVLNMTPSWANGTDVFMRFFEANQARIRVLNVDAFISDKRGLDPRQVFIMTPDEVQRAVDSRKFKPIQPERTIKYPNGADGFIFTRLAYVDNIDQIFQAEKEARQRPVTVQATLDGQPVTVNHSVIDSGQIRDLIDGDKFTLIRFREANPALIEFVFPQPRAINTLVGTFGSMDFSLDVQLFPADGGSPTAYTQSYRDLPPDPSIELPLANPPAQVNKVRILVKDLRAGETAKIHVREIGFR